MNKISILRNENLPPNTLCTFELYNNTDTVHKMSKKFDFYKFITATR